MMYHTSHPTDWLEFRLVSDGLETKAVQVLPLTAWHAANNPVFGFFTALPTELRLNVWEYLIVPRIVGIACPVKVDETVSCETYRDELWGSQDAIRPSIPVLLHVNRETRTLALKHYELSFEWEVPRVLWDSDLAPPTAASHHHPATDAQQPTTPTIPAFESSSSISQTSHLNNGQDELLAHMHSYHELIDPRPDVLSSYPIVSESSSSSEVGQGGDQGQADNTRRGITATPRVSSPPRTWFNFNLDAIYLVGALNLYDSFGYITPMASFIPSQTARRVRRTAAAFGALGYGEMGPQQMFVALFLVLYYFAPPDKEVLVCVTERDEWTHAMLGNQTPLVNSGGSNSDGLDSQYGGEAEEEKVNILQKIWRDEYPASLEILAKIKFVLIRENDLEQHVRESSLARREDI